MEFKESINKLLNSKDGELFKLLQSKCTISKEQQIYSERNFNRVNQLSAIVDNLSKRKELGETIVSRIEKLIENTEADLFLKYFMPILQAVLGGNRTLDDTALTQFASYLNNVNFNIEYSESVIDMTFLSTLYQQHNLDSLIVSESPSTSDVESNDPKQERIQVFINSVTIYKDELVDTKYITLDRARFYGDVVKLANKVLEKLNLLAENTEINHFYTYMTSLGGLITVLQSLDYNNQEVDFNALSQLLKLIENDAVFDSFLKEGHSSKAINVQFDRVKKTANYQEMQLETLDQKVETKKESTTHSLTKGTAINLFNQYAKKPSVSTIESYKNKNVKTSIANKCIEAIQKDQNEVKLSNKEWEIYNHKDYGQQLRKLVSDCQGMVTVVEPTDKEKAIDRFNDYLTDNNKRIGFESGNDQKARIALARKFVAAINDNKKELEMSADEYETLNQNSSRSLRDTLNECKSILTVKIKPQTLTMDSQANSPTQNKQQSTTSRLRSVFGKVKKEAVEAIEVFSSPVQQPMTKERALKRLNDYLSNDTRMFFEDKKVKNTKQGIAKKLFDAISSDDETLALSKKEMELLASQPGTDNHVFMKELNKIITQCEHIIKVSDKPASEMELKDQKQLLMSSEAMTTYGNLGL